MKGVSIDILKWPPSDYDFMGLQWTTEPPTREGWYWAINKDDREIWLYRVFRADHGGNDKPLEAWVDQYESMRLSDFSHWLGPLPVPAPPSEGE